MDVKEEGHEFLSNAPYGNAW
jgi:hypothetical protein